MRTLAENFEPGFATVPRNRIDRRDDWLRELLGIADPSLTEREMFCLLYLALSRLAKRCELDDYYAELLADAEQMVMTMPAEWRLAVLDRSYLFPELGITQIVLHLLGAD